MLAVTAVEHVAVNVSSPSLAAGDYADRVTELILVHEVDPRRLRLEVTETALLGMAPMIIESMQAVAELGVDLVRRRLRHGLLVHQPSA